MVAFRIMRFSRCMFLGYTSLLLADKAIGIKLSMKQTKLNSDSLVHLSQKVIPPFSALKEKGGNRANS